MISSKRASNRRSLLKGEMEETIHWLLTHKQKEVQTVLRKFRKLPLVKQRQLDRKLIYLVSILEYASKLKKARNRGRSV